MKPANRSSLLVDRGDVAGSHSTERFKKRENNLLVAGGKIFYPIQLPSAFLRLIFRTTGWFAHTSQVSLIFRPGLHRRIISKLAATGAPSCVYYSSRVNQSEYYMLITSRQSLRLETVLGYGEMVAKTPSTLP